MGIMGRGQLIIFFLGLQLVTNSTSSKPNICYRNTNTHSDISHGQDNQDLLNDLQFTTHNLNLSNRNKTDLKSFKPKRYAYIDCLDLSHNALSTTYSMEGIEIFKEVKRLDISGNDISIFDPSAFARNQRLEMLNVANNPHLFIEGKCALLSSLKWLSFNGSNLENFPTEMLRCIPNLEYLDFSNNQLRSLPSNIKAILPNIQCMLLSNNPFNTTDLELSNITVQKRGYSVCYSILSNLTNNGISSKDDESDSDLDYVGIMQANASKASSANTLLVLAMTLTTMVMIRCEN